MGDMVVINPAPTPDFPIADGIRFEESTDCASEAGKVLGCTGLLHTGSGTPSRGLATIFRERLKNGATPDKRLGFIASSRA